MTGTIAPPCPTCGFPVRGVPCRCGRRHRLATCRCAAAVRATHAARRRAECSREDVKRWLRAVDAAAARCREAA